MIQNLDGRITRIQSFQGTICGINIECHNKLLYRILGEIDPEVENAKKSLQEFQQSLLVLVKRLNPKDFELLIELIFSSLGWRRSSLIGGTQKDIDIAFFNPISEKSSYIQIKTQARSLDLQRFVESVCGNYDSDSVYFVYHTGIDEGFSDIKNKYDNLVLWNGERVVELVINAGLIQWVMDRAG